MSAIEADTREEVWVANGLRKPWRICSNGRAFGEFDRLEDANTFIHLLVLGDPSLRRLV